MKETVSRAYHFGLMTREAVHHDGHYDNADRHDGGARNYLASSPRLPVAWDSGVHQVSALLIENSGGHQIAIHRMTPGAPPPLAEQVMSGWLQGLRAYLGVILAGDFLWESLHLPLYTIWTTGTLAEEAFAVVHCTLGDLLVALSALMLALIIAGDRAWPRDRFWSVGMLTLIFGVSYTAFSEWLNIVVRQSWAYSERMPIIPLFGFRIGLSPLFQWVTVPAAAFGLVRWMTFRHSNGGRR